VCEVSVEDPEGPLALAARISEALDAMAALSTAMSEAVAADDERAVAKH
jgi:hypothetical protein